MAKPWNEIAGSDDFKALPDADKEAVRADYFDRVIAPEVGEGERDAVRADFMSRTAGSLRPAAGSRYKEGSNLLERGLELAKSVGRNVADSAAGLWDEAKKAGGEVVDSMREGRRAAERERVTRDAQARYQSGTSDAVDRRALSAGLGAVRDRKLAESGRPAPEPVPSRDFTDVVGDTVVAGRQGMRALGKAGMFLANEGLDLATGSRSPTLTGMQESVAIDDAADQRMKSVGLQAASKNVESAKGFLGTAKAMLENPAVIWDGIVQSAPSIIPGLGAARVAGRSAAALGASEKVATRAAVGGALAGEGAMSAGVTGSEVERFVLDMDPEKLAENSAAFRAFMDQGLSVDEAKNRLAAVLSSDAAIKSGIATAFISAATGVAGVEAKVATGKYKATLGQGVKTLAKESAQESLQNPAEEFAGYQSKVQADPNQTFDLGKAAAQGALTAAGQAGGIHLAGMGRERLANALGGNSDPLPAGDVVGTATDAPAVKGVWRSSDGREFRVTGETQTDADGVSYSAVMMPDGRKVMMPTEELRSQMERDGTFTPDAALDTPAGALPAPGFSSEAVRPMGEASSFDAERDAMVQELIDRNEQREREREAEAARRAAAMAGATQEGTTVPLKTGIGATIAKVADQNEEMFKPDPAAEIAKLEQQTKGIFAQALKAARDAGLAEEAAQKAADAAQKEAIKSLQADAGAVMAGVTSPPGIAGTIATAQQELERVGQQRRPREIAAPAPAAEAPAAEAPPTLDEPNVGEIFAAAKGAPKNASDIERSILSAQQDLERVAQRTQPKGRAKKSRTLKRRIENSMIEQLKRRYAANTLASREAQRRAIERIAKVFGKTVVWDENLGADGLVYPATPNTIYLNPKSDMPVLAVFAHEMLHSMRRQNEATYQKLLARVMPMMKNVGKYRDWLEGEIAKEQLKEDGIENATDEQIAEYLNSRSLEQRLADVDMNLEEMLADFMGEFSLDAGFWKDVFAGQSRSFVEAVRDMVLKAIEGIGGRVRFMRAEDVDSYIADDFEDGVRKALVEAFNEWSSGKIDGQGDANADAGAETEARSLKARSGELRDGGGVRGGPRLLDVPSRPYPVAEQTVAGLPARVEVDGRVVEFGAFAPAQAAAREYMRRAGLEYSPPTTYAKVDRERAQRIAAAFDAMPHAPEDPKVKAAYAAMISETLAQWQVIKETGLAVEFIDFDKTGDPYGNPRNAILDVVNNNHLWVFPTSSGFGGTESADVDISGNPLLAYTDEIISGRRAQANDIFRIVHDYFGHIKDGFGFRAEGEENAWQSHAAMYSDQARAAMTSETRGQNSWVNFGPFANFNKTANGADTQYAPQKIGLLPDWVMTEGRVMKSRPSKEKANGRTAPSVPTTGSAPSREEIGYGDQQKTRGIPTDELPSGIRIEAEKTIPDDFDLNNDPADLHWVKRRINVARYAEPILEANEYNEPFMETAHQLGEEISRDGQREPIIIGPGGIEGNHRLVGMYLGGIKTADAYVAVMRRPALKSRTLRDRLQSMDSRDPRTGVTLSKAQRAVSLDKYLYAFDLLGTRFPNIGMLAQAFDAAAAKAFKGSDHASYTPANERWISTVLTHEALLALEKRGNAKGWYKRSLNNALKEVEKVYPEVGSVDGRFLFTVALAITSNGQTIEDNVRLAFHAFEHYRRHGGFPGALPGGGERAHTMVDGFRMANDLIARMSVSGFRQWALSKQPSRLVRDSYGVSLSAYHADAEVYGGAVFGPKIGGAFLQNLNGNFDALTIDLWMMRVFGRVTGSLAKADGSGAKDTPTSAGQRVFITNTMERTLAAVNERGHKLEMADLQALLWYPEKELYSILGVADKRAQPTDYEAEVRNHVESHRKSATRPKPARGRDRETVRERLGLAGGGREETQRSLFSRGSGAQGQVFRVGPAVARGPDGAVGIPSGFSGQVGPRTPAVSVRIPQGDGVSIVGIHYGKVDGLNALDPRRFGTGARSEETKAIKPGDPLANRVYFYAQRRDGVIPPPEGVVTGAYVYRALVENIYDFATDPRGIWPAWDKAGRPGKELGLEQMVKEAGYDGYLNRNHFGGAIVVFSDAPVPVESLGVRSEAARIISKGAVDHAAHQAATSPRNDLSEPTLAQIEAGNYKKGHVRIGGLDIAIENPAGSKRRPEWPALRAHYGYIKRTEGNDGDHVDVFIKPGTPTDWSGPVYVVDQTNADGSFDEHKIMLGWTTRTNAQVGYLDNYTPGWGRYDGIRMFENPQALREWIENGDQTRRATDRVLASRKQTETAAFKKWFGDSKVVDAKGRPLVVYHGTDADITEFRSQADRDAGLQAGIYFTTDKSLAGAYAKRNGAVYPVYLSIRNPLDLTDTSRIEGWKGAVAKLIAPRLAEKVKQAAAMRDGLTQSLVTADERGRLEAAGYDGIKGAGGVWIAFRPEQIKSATGNAGTFDANNPSILRSRPSRPFTIEKLTDDFWQDVTGRYRIDRVDAGGGEFTFDASVGHEENFRSFANLAQAKAWLKSMYEQDQILGVNEQKSVLDKYAPSQQQAVLEGWLEIAKRMGSFTFGKSEAKSLKQIAEDLGVKTLVRVQNIAPGVDELVFEGDQRAELRAWPDGTYYLEASDMKKGGDGQALYQIALTWAKNNGEKLVPDTNLSWINTFRRTEQMLSAALRLGTTKHMEPHRDQRINDWNFEPKSEMEDRENLLRLVLTTYENTKQIVDDASQSRGSINGMSDLAYDFGDGRIVHAKTRKAFTPAEMVILLGQKASREAGLGELTLARALITQELLGDEVLAVEDIKAARKSGTEVQLTDKGVAVKSGPDSVRRGVLYSRKQTQTPEFKRWFGNSKVVDANGEPLVVYHGTKTPQKMEGSLDGKAYASKYPLFTDNSTVAAGYAVGRPRERGFDDAPTVVPVYLSIKNPFDTSKMTQADMDAILSVKENVGSGDRNRMDVVAWARRLESDFKAGRSAFSFAWTGIPDAVINKIESAGYDGLKDRGGKMGGTQHTVWMPFSSAQVKSAIGNSGAFDPKSPSILKSRRGGMTPERLNRVIEEYLYTDGRVKAGITWMSPRQFLDLVDSKRGEEIVRQEVEEFGPANRQQTVPINLRVEPDGTVDGHEGRHRMIGLMDEGIEKVAVVIRRYQASRDPLPTYLHPQDHGGGVRGRKGTFIDPPMPITWENRQRLKAEFVDTADIRFSRSRPLLKTAAMLGRLSLDALRGATAVAAPVTKTAQVINKGADLALRLGLTPVTAVTSRVYDRVAQWGSTFFEGGEYRQKFAHGIIADYGLPEPYVDARDDREIAINKALRKSKELLDQIASLDRQESRVAYLWMQEKPNTREEQALMAVLPPQSVAILQAMKQQIDDLGKEAVRLGLLSQDSYNRNHLAYLHRTYQKYELENPQAVARTKAAKTIRGEAYRGRGLRDNVSDTTLPATIKKGDKYLRLEKRKPNGVLQNVAYVPAGQPIPAKYAGWTQDGEWEARFFDRQKSRGEIGMWRDLTAQERARLGEIDEIRYSFARTMIATVRDIETARFLDWTARTYSKSKTDILLAGGEIIDPTGRFGRAITYSANQWVLVPNTEVKGTDIPKYGRLANTHVPGRIWNDIRQMIDLSDPSVIGQMYDELLKAWKISKTALSPAVHTNNVMANVVLADAAEVGPEDLRRALNLILDAHRGNAQAKAMMERFYDSGSEISSQAAIELRQDVIEPLLKEMEKQQNAAAAQVGYVQAIRLAVTGNPRMALAAMAAKKGTQMAAMPFRLMIEAYRSEDSVFRLAKFLNGVAAGLTDKEAGKEARKAFLDYRINAPWIQSLRRGPLPFLAFSYRAIPLMIETAANKPWKLMKYFLVGSALNMMAYAMLGAAGEEDKERKRLPPEKSGRALGIFPRMIRMPWNDENDSPVFLDVRRWIPGGDIMDTTGSKGAIPLPPWLSVGGPLALFVEMVSNKNMFTGKEIVKQTDTKGEATAAVMDHVYKFMTPNLPIPNPAGWWMDDALNQRGLFQSYSWKGIESAGKGETDAFGRERNMGQAMAGALGVKVGSYPEDVAIQNAKFRYDTAMRELQQTRSEWKRMLSRKGVTQQQFDRKMEDLAVKQRELAEKLREVVE